MTFAVGYKSTFYLLTYLLTYLQHHHHYDIATTAVYTSLLLLLCYHVVMQAHMGKFGGTSSICGRTPPKSPSFQVGNCLIHMQRRATIKMLLYPRCYSCLTFYLFLPSVVLEVAMCVCMYWFISLLTISQ